MTAEARAQAFAERIEQLRQDHPDPLVAHGQDAVGAEVGGAVWRRIPWDANHEPSGGTIVEVGHNDETGEPTATTVGFRGAGSRREVVVTGLVLSDCSPPLPSDDNRCIRVARQLWALLGQPVGANGPPLSPLEQRMVHWTRALLGAVLDRTEANRERST